MKMSDNTVRVWDPIVRIGHWTLVLAFFVAYFTEDDFLTLHVWAGYLVVAVVLLRLVWGFIGSTRARFSNFVRSPTTTFRYLRDLVSHRARRYIGHNPAGGAMIVALLISLSGTAYSGLVLYAIEEDAGPLAGWVVESDESPATPAKVSGANADEERHDDADDADEEGHDDADDVDDEAGEEFWEELHEFFANFTLLLVLLHVVGVVHASYADKENLVKAMFTGRKRGVEE